MEKEEKTMPENLVHLRLGPASWHMDGFDPSIEGVPVIGQEPVPVPASLEKAVRERAREHGLTIKKEG